MVFRKILIASLFFAASLIHSQTSIRRLDYKDPVIKKLREEVKTNLKNSRSSRPEKPVELKYYSYKVKPKDNFYKIMAMTGMDIDTLSSVNNLSSPLDIHGGMELVIPSSRGVFIKKMSREEISAKFRIHPLNISYDEDRKSWFVPGITLPKEEKSYFYGFAFMRPLKGGRLSSRYGMRRDPFTSKRTFHGGVDIAAKKNSPVFASAAGKVVFSGKKGGYGNLVIIRHKLGYETRYGHLNSSEVKAGETVNKGMLIGKVGSTGRSTGYHLHFEVRRNKVRQNPRFHAFLVRKDLQKK